MRLSFPFFLHHSTLLKLHWFSMVIFFKKESLILLNVSEIFRYFIKLAFKSWKFYSLLFITVSCIVTFYYSFWVDNPELIFISSYNMWYFFSTKFTCFCPISNAHKVGNQMLFSIQDNASLWFCDVYVLQMWL